MYFRYAPKNSVLGDVNSDLMNAWRQIRARPLEIWTAVNAIPVSSSEYYAIRDEHRSDPFERAVRFIYLNRNCFNGVYRTNRKSQFNVPFGRNTGALPPAENFEACASLLKDARLVSGDFTNTLSEAGEGDVVYLDPPWPTLRANYGEYGYNGGEPAIARMQHVIDELVERGAGVYVSLPAALSNQLRAGLTAEFAVTYSVASRANHRKATSEVLLVAGERALRAAEIA